MKFAKMFKNTYFTERLSWLLPLPKHQKKQKDILRKDTLQIFLLKHNDAKKVIIKFNESVF